MLTNARCEILRVKEEFVLLRIYKDFVHYEFHNPTDPERQEKHIKILNYRVININNMAMSVDAVATYRDLFYQNPFRNRRSVDNHLGISNLNYSIAISRKCRFVILNGHNLYSWEAFL
jgi:hypothetical protein